MKYAMFLILAAVLSSCAILSPNSQRRELATALVEDPARLVEIDGVRYPQSELALVEITAPDFGAWIIAIDGKSVSAFNELSPDTVFLKPGTHSFKITFRNIQGLRSVQVTSDVSASLESSHTYMPHNHGFSEGSLNKSKTAAFAMADYGAHFPRGCLTGQITKRENAQVASFATRQALYKKCIDAAGYKNKYEYVSPELYR